MSGAEDTALVALLAGTELPADGAAGLQPVADVLAALRAAPASDELAGEAAALAEFRQQVRVSVHPQGSRRRRPTLLSQLLTAKGAAAAAIAAVTLTGAGVAAASGHLPTPLQNLAHHVGAPAPQSSQTASSSASPVGPNATGPAAFGLCTSYEHAKANGSASFKHSIAYRNLAAAAGGASNIATYCQGVAHPGSASPSPAAAAGSQATSHATGQPSTAPGGNGGGKGSQATSHPTGKPTSTP